MDKLIVDVIVNGIDVEFTGEVFETDESFGHAFGIEKVIGRSVESINWNRAAHNDEENALIIGWLLQERNCNKVIDLLIEKYKNQ